MKCPQCDGTRYDLNQERYAYLNFETRSPSYRSRADAVQKLEADRRRDELKAKSLILERYKIVDYKLHGPKHAIALVRIGRSKVPTEQRWLFDTDHHGRLQAFLWIDPADDGHWPTQEELARAAAAARPEVGSEPIPTQPTPGSRPVPPTQPPAPTPPPTAPSSPKPPSATKPPKPAPQVKKAPLKLTAEQRSAVKQAISSQGGTFVTHMVDMDKERMLIVDLEDGPGTAGAPFLSRARKEACGLLQALHGTEGPWTSILLRWRTEWQSKFGERELKPVALAELTRSAYARIVWKNLTPKEQLKLVRFEDDIRHDREGWTPSDGKVPKEGSSSGGGAFGGRGR